MGDIKLSTRPVVTPNGHVKYENSDGSFAEFVTLSVRAGDLESTPQHLSGLAPDEIIQSHYLLRLHGRIDPKAILAIADIKQSKNLIGEDTYIEQNGNVRPKFFTFLYSRNRNTNNGIDLGKWSINGLLFERGWRTDLTPAFLGPVLSVDTSSYYVGRVRLDEESMRAERVVCRTTKRTMPENNPVPAEASTETKTSNEN